MLKTFAESICAGILIAVGGSVFLACENRVVGAVLFSVALLCICYKGYYLYTGKVGYMVESHRTSDIAALLIGLFGNLITACLLGFVVRFAIPGIGKAAESLCPAKLDQSFLQTLLRAMFCGVLMYLAVSIFRDKKTPVAILYGIPVFILSGFEHSIADMFYFGASGTISGRVLLFVFAAVLGNSLGAVILPLLSVAGTALNRRKEEES
jgi:formate/nitrite transporter FocA (FNT family)